MARLPSNYQEVEYLQSSGTQYIDTGIVPIENDEIELQNVFCVKSSDTQSIFSAGTGTYQLILLVGIYSEDVYFKYFASGRAKNIYQKIDTPTNIVVNNTGIYYNSILQETSNYENSVNTNLFLFRRANNTSYATAKIGIVKLTRNNSLVRNLVPCYRKSDNVAGMYDLVNGVFYTNSGTGTFIVGPNVKEEVETYTECYIVSNPAGHDLPNEYQEVEHLESSGTQYIDTGILPSQLTKTKAKYSINNVSATNVQYICGARNVSGVAIGYDIYSDWHGGATMYANAWIEVGKILTDNEVVETETLISPPNIEFKVNGETKYTGTAAVDRTGTNKLTLFALNGGTAEYLSGARIYYHQMYNDNTLVRNLIPCYRKSDSLAGMYDLENSGKNLFDGVSELGDYSLGTKVSANKWRTGNKIPVKPSTTYSIVAINKPSYATFTRLNATYYDADGNFIGEDLSGTWQLGGSTTTPSNAYYITFSSFGSVITSQAQASEFGNTFMMVEGSEVPTAYEPCPFYTNKGTGTFVVGPDVDKYTEIEAYTEILVVENSEAHDLPNGYQEVEYLESTGTQYIDTGLHITTNYAKVKAKITPLDWDGSNPNRRGWGVQSSSDNCFTSWDNSVEGSGSVHPDGWLALGSSWYFNKTSSTFFNTTLGQPYEMDFTANNGTAIGSYAGETFNNSYSGTLINSSRSIYLFDCNAHYVHVPTSSKIYYFELETAEGSRNLIPCYRKSDSVAGMYDLVNNVFYTNAGTGTFAVGPNVDKYTEIETYTECYIVE